MAESDGLRSVTRRQVLKAGGALAALGGVSAFIAACGGSATPAPSTGGGGSASTAPLPSTGGGGASTPPSAGGTVSFGSNYSDDVPKKAMQARWRYSVPYCPPGTG